MVVGVDVAVVVDSGADGLQPKVLAVRGSSDGDYDLVDLERRVAGADGGRAPVYTAHAGVLRCGSFHRVQCCLEQDGYAAAGERFGDQGTSERLQMGEQPRFGLDERDLLGAEAV